VEPNSTIVKIFQVSMKNALKCVYGLLDLVKIREIGTIFTETGQYYDDHTLPLSLCQSVRNCPKFLKICQLTNFDMGFQKKNVLGRSEDLDFFSSAIFTRTPT
jgi:hypothetical protein